MNVVGITMSPDLLNEKRLCKMAEGVTIQIEALYIVSSARVISVGFSTFPTLWGLLRGYRAVPYLALDESSILLLQSAEILAEEKRLGNALLC
jgi:hypothetical protein